MAETSFPFRVLQETCSSVINYIEVDPLIARGLPTPLSFQVQQKKDKAKMYLKLWVNAYSNQTKKMGLSLVQIVPTMLPITRCQAVKEPTADTSIYIAAYRYTQYISMCL